MKGNFLIIAVCYLCLCICTSACRCIDAQIRLLPHDDNQSSGVESYEFRFKPLSAATVSFAGVEGCDVEEEAVPWRVEDRIRVGYSRSEVDTVYFAVLFSRPIVSESGLDFKFETGKRGRLAATISRSGESTVDAVNLLQASLEGRTDQ